MIGLERRNKNLSIVTVASLKLYFYNETVIAFDHPATGPTACQNVWNKTIGKSITKLGFPQVKYDSFRKTLNQLLNSIRMDR